MTMQLEQSPTTGDEVITHYTINFGPQHPAAQETGDQPAQPFLLMLEHEAAIACERLIGPVARQRNGDLFARELADAIGRQRARIGERFVEHVGDRVDQPDPLPFPGVGGEPARL